MAKLIGTSLLAACALGSLALAGARIAGATERGGDYEMSAGVQINPGTATATLSRLRTPSGFSRGRCSDYIEHPDACFSRGRSISLDKTVWSGLYAAMEVTPYVEPVLAPIGAIKCLRGRHPRRGRLTLQACEGEGLLGGERVWLSASSVLVAGSTRTYGTTRTLRGFPKPTEVRVYVLGPSKES